MRKFLVLAAAFLLLAATGAAAEIVSPAEDQEFTQSVAAPLQIDAGGAVEYSVNGGPRQDCGDACDGGATLTGADGLEQGRNRIAVYEDGAVDDSVSFVIDTEPPEVTLHRPGDGELILDERTPPLQIFYSDVSRIANGSVRVTVDGEPVAGNATQELFEAHLTDIAEGTHRVRYRVPDEHWRDPGHNATDEFTFKLPVRPVVLDRAPRGPVDDAPRLRLLVDDPAGIAPNASSVTVTGPGGERAVDAAVTRTDGAWRFAHRFEDLADGEYAVAARIADQEGNVREVGWNFTVDTTPPEVTIAAPAERDVVTGDEVVRFTVDDATGVAGTRAVLGRASARGIDTGDGFRARLDTTRAEDGVRTLQVRAEDDAGNAAVVNRTVVVDNGPPALRDIDIYPSPAVAGIAVEAVAVDDATNVVGASYRLEDDDGAVVAEGALDAVAGAYDTGREPARTSFGFEPGEGTHRLVLTARDAAGHVDREVRRVEIADGRPDLAVDANRTAVVTRNRTAVVEVAVRNTGDADAYVGIGADSVLGTDVSPATRRVGAGETKRAAVTVTGNASLGPHPLRVNADGFADAAERRVEVLVQPPAATRERIRAEFSALREDLREVNESLGAVVDENLSRSVAETGALLANVSALLDRGRYGRAAEMLEEAEISVNRTEQALTAEISRARIARLASFGARLLAFLLVLGLIAGAYLLLPPEEGFDRDRGFVHRPDGKHPLRLRAERWVERRLPDEDSGEEDGDGYAVGRWKGFDASSGS